MPDSIVPPAVWDRAPELGAFVVLAVVLMGFLRWLSKEHRDGIAAATGQLAAIVADRDRQFTAALRDHRDEYLKSIDRIEARHEAGELKAMEVARTLVEKTDKALAENTQALVRCVVVLDRIDRRATDHDSDPDPKAPRGR